MERARGYLILGDVPGDGAAPGQSIGASFKSLAVLVQTIPYLARKTERVEVLSNEANQSVTEVAIKYANLTASELFDSRSAIALDDDIVFLE